MSVFVLNPTRVFDWSVRASERDTNTDEQRYTRRPYWIQVPNVMIMVTMMMPMSMQLLSSAVVVKVKSRPVTSSQKSLAVGREIRSTVVSVTYDSWGRNKTFL